LLSGLFACRSEALSWQDLEAQRSGSGSQGFSTSSYARAETKASPSAALAAPSVQPAQYLSSREEKEESEARRLRQVVLQQDAARTLGKNAAKFQASKVVGHPSTPSSPPRSPVGRRPDPTRQTSEPLRSLEPDAVIPSADRGNANADDFSSQSGSHSVSSLQLASRDNMGVVQSENEKSETAKSESAQAAADLLPAAGSRLQSPMQKRRVQEQREEPVNYREAWREAANRNLFNMLSKARAASATVSRSASAGSAIVSRASEDSASADSEDLDQEQLEALPILEQYAATPSSTLISSTPVSLLLEEELPELEVVGNQVVGKQLQTRQTTLDTWKVIAPKGLIVHAGCVCVCLRLCVCVCVYVCVCEHAQQVQQQKSSCHKQAL